MIGERIRQLIGKIPYVFVATVDSQGQPHMAIGEQVALGDNSLLIFENWFCPVTLQNIAGNSQVSVVVFTPDTGNGYQILGSVVRSMDAAILNGYDPVADLHDTPQVLTRFTVRIEKVLEFTGGIHSDIPLAE